MIGRLAIGYAILCEYLGAGLFALYAVLFSLIGIKNHQIARAIEALLICTAIAAALFFTARATMNCHRWGYWASLAYGLCIGWFTEICFRGAYEGMPNAHGEEGWAFLLGVILACGTAIGLVGLLLPSTRREFFGCHDDTAAG